jgi:Uma2 family endonuclease
MVVATPTYVLPSIPVSRLKRFTATEYNRLTDSGVFTTEDRFELLEGWLVNKMSNNPPHASAIGMLEDAMIALLVAPWIFRTQMPIELSGDSVPEPDLVVVKGPRRKFVKSHPTASEIALVVEVSHTTLDQDRGIKQKLYARDRIPEYWIVNLVDRVVEVYTHPKAGKMPGYRPPIVYRPESTVPLRLDGEPIGQIPVASLMP